MLISERKSEIAIAVSDFCCTSAVSKKNRTMIKAEDLMIGDWVFFYGGYGSDENKNYSVRAIGEQYGGNAIFLNGCGSDPSYGDELFPILITQEVLERNGFQKETWTTSSWKRHLGGYDHWCDIFLCGDKCHFRIKDDGLFTCVKTIYYVHELQHIFHLFGIKQNWVIEQSDDIDWSLINGQ